MSVSRSLHAYRMDRIWLKAPKAEKCADRLHMALVDWLHHSYIFEQYNNYIFRTVW